MLLLLWWATIPGEHMVSLLLGDIIPKKMHILMLKNFIVDCVSLAMLPNLVDLANAELNKL